MNMICGSNEMHQIRVDAILFPPGEPGVGNKQVEPSACPFGISKSMSGNGLFISPQTESENQLHRIGKDVTSRLGL